MSKDRELENLEKYLTDVNAVSLTAEEITQSQARVFQRVKQSQKGNFWAIFVLPVVAIAVPVALVVMLVLTGVILRPFRLQPTAPDVAIADTLNQLDQQTAYIDSDLQTVDTWQASVTDLSNLY